MIRLCSKFSSHRQLPDLYRTNCLLRSTGENNTYSKRSDIWSVYRSSCNKHSYGSKIGQVAGAFKKTAFNKVDLKLLLFGPSHHAVAKLHQQRQFQSNSQDGANKKKNETRKSREKYMIGEVPTREVFKLLGQNIWPKDNLKVKLSLVGSLSCLAVAKGLTIGVPFIFKYIVDTLNDASLDFTKTGETLMSLDCPKTWVIAAVIGYGAGRIGASLFQESRNAIFSFVSQSSMQRVAGGVFSHLHNSDKAFIHDNSPAGLCDDISRGTKGMETGLRLFAMNIIPSFIEVCLVAGILSYKCGPVFAGVTMATIFIYTGATYKVTRWRTKFYQEKNRLDKQTVVKAAESLDNYDTVKYFNNEDHELQEYKGIWRKYMRATLRTQISLATLNFTQNLIYNAGVATLMGLTVTQIMSGSLTVGDLVMVNGLLFQLNAQLNFVGSTYREIKQSHIDITNMFGLKKLHSTIKSAPGALPLNISGDMSSIKFDNVYFGYDTQPNVLNGLSFTVPSGKKAAIVGSSGSGKSTIINLLYRFYDPLQGGVYVNGQSVKEVEINSLRKAVGIVPQKPKFFNKSIYYNLSYGDLTKSREEVLEAATKARVPDILMRDLERDMGEKGEKVSLGQAQRIAIARVILKDPHIILYDEATSSLDTVTEREIMSNLKDATKGKTTLVIAHRLSTVVDCDLILVLDKGRIVEQGTHHELLSNKDSIYTSMWRYQSQLPEDLDNVRKEGG